MRRPLAALVAFAALVFLHEVLAHALDRAELVERLLSPGPGALVAFPFAMLLYALRLALIFLGPGLAALALVSLAVRARAQRVRADHRR